MKTHEFWRETKTGDVWAVELADGVVARVHGPLHWSEITPEYLHLYDYTLEGASRIEASREEFEPLDERSVLLFSASVD